MANNHHSPAASKINRIRTLQWNCRNFGLPESELDETGFQSRKTKTKKLNGRSSITANRKQNLFLFMDTLQELKPDVVLLQSVNLHRQEMQEFPGYTLVSWGKRYQNNQISTAIYVSNKLSAENARTIIPRTNGASSCSCKIILRNKKTINFNSAYFPLGPGNIDLKFFDNMKENEKETWVLGGDFNKHHSYWSKSPRAIKINDKFAEAVMNAEMILLNDKTPTRPPSVIGHLPTAIDLSLASPSLKIENWAPLPEHINGSDHFPIIFDIVLSEDNSEKINIIPKRNYAKANWEIYESNLLSKSIHTDHFHPSVNVHLDNIINSMDEAADTAIPMISNKPIKTHFGPWFTEDCKAAIKEERKRNRILYSDKNGYTLKNKLAKQIAENIRKKVIAEAKLNYMNRYIQENVSDYKDTSKLWRKIKKLKNRKSTGIKRTLYFKGEPYTTNPEKAKLLAQQISYKSQNASLSKKEQEFRAHFEANYLHPPENNSLPINKEITEKELNDALNSIKKTDKAPGNDKITYQLLIKTPPSFRKVILDLFNHCYTSGQVPCLWKQANVVALLKEGKLPTDPDSYRPISLTPCISKIYERILNTRLEYFLETKNVLPNSQSGFRRFRSTTDNLVHLTEKIKKTLRRKNTVRYITCFDIKKAFDKVWHTKLLSKLKKIGLSGHIYNAIRSILFKRTLRVQYEDALSDKFHLDMGTPQGAVLSPTLFTIMLYDIHNISHKNHDILLFADDIAIISKNYQVDKYRHEDIHTPRYLEHTELIHNLECYMKENGFSFSGEKTQFFPIAKPYLDSYRNVQIKVGEAIIKKSDTIKYLGIHFHYNLNWSTHFNHIISKSRQALNLLRILACQHWAKASKFLITVAKSLIRSRISYGQECFFGATKYQKESLDKLEARAIKIALGLPNTASSEKARDEIQWTSLEENRRLRCAQYVARIQTLDTHLNKKLVTTKDNFTIPPGNGIPLGKASLHPLKSYVRPLLYKANIKPKDIEYWEFGETPPGLLVTPKIIKPVQWAKTEAPLLAGTETNIFINENLQEHIQIYTDASVYNDPKDNHYGKTGFGIAVKFPNEGFTNELTSTVKTPNFMSTFSIELTALLHAMLFIRDFIQNSEEAERLNKIAILTDSLSSLQSLLSTPKQRFFIHYGILQILTEVTNKGYSVCFIHVPSHCGVTGNEIADTLAKQAALCEVEPFPIPYSKGEMFTELDKVILKLPHLFPTFQKFPKPCPIIPPFAPHLILLYRRLKTKSSMCQYKIITCQCGERIKLPHILKGCEPLKEVTKDLLNFMQENELQEDNILLKHDRLQWQHTRLLCETLYNSKIGYCF